MRLLILFIVIPAVELILLIELGKIIGGLATVGLIILTGVIGASLAKHQGLSVIQKAREEMEQGRVPAQSLGDGVIILLAGALLITPGVLTDLVGFLCLVPGTRHLIKAYLRRRFERAVREGRVRMNVRFTADMRQGGAGERGAEERRDPRSSSPADRKPEADGPVRDVPFEIGDE